MTSLVLMYVYFDQNGDIKAITPAADPGMLKDYNQTMLPFSEVEPFLTGKRSTYDYIIKIIKKFSGNNFVLTRKHTSVNLTRSIDSYLTEIGIEVHDECAIRIAASPRQNSITISLNSGYRALYDIGTDDEKDTIDEFLSSGPSYIHITEKGNPYHLLHTITFLPRELFDLEKIVFHVPDDIDLRNSSAYTKRLVESYSYNIKDY